MQASNTHSIYRLPYIANYDVIVMVAVCIKLDVTYLFKTYAYITDVGICSTVYTKLSTTYKLHR